MKKLVIGLCVVILLIGLVLTIYIVKSANGNIYTPQRGITLNNVLSGDANEMVLNFKNNKGCRGKKIAFWLNKAWVDNICKIIKNEHGDGIRLYFAKELKDKKNTLIIVSTYRVGPDGKTESKNDHVDYYDHSDPFFNTKDTLLTRDSEKYPGATLFEDTCPCQPNGCYLLSSSDNITCKQAYVAVQNLNAKSNDQKINTNSEWFSLKRIVAIKEDLDQQTKDNPNEPGTGIRVYFAKHKNKKETTDNEKHQNRHAFIIVTTKCVSLGGQKYNWDYFSCLSKSVHFSGTDNGEQCPDNCTGSTLPKP